MNKGEIWLVDIPGIKGHEQEGKRPVVIIAELEANISIIIPCTTNKNALRFKNTICLEPNVKNGLKELSILLIFQLRAIDKKRLKRKIGKIDNQLQSKINNVILNMLNLSSK